MWLDNNLVLATLQSAFCSSADVLLEFNATLLASHEAAPVELAPAAFDDDPSACLEAAPAAHQLAAVGACRLPVAEATARTQRAGLAVRLAEVRGRGDEDQVGVGGRAEAVVARDEFTA